MPVKKKTGKGRLDKFYWMAKDQGYRSRSSFKLVQLAKKFDFLSQSTVCLDLCGAPGGWAQVCQKQMPSKSKIVCVDLMPIRPIFGVIGLQGDITTEKCRNALKKELGGKPADVVLNDGAPNMGTSWTHDAYSQSELTLHACKLASEFLKPGGHFVTKVFRSGDYNNLLYVFQQLFEKVVSTKPQASRDVSAEIFVICSNYIGNHKKQDKRLFDPKWVFMEQQEDANEAQRKTSASLADVVKYATKKRRSGYTQRDEYQAMPAIQFLKETNAVDTVTSINEIIFEDEESLAIKNHKLTDSEILECCKDVKVLGKNELGKLLRWRIKLKREHEKKKKEGKTRRTDKGMGTGHLKQKPIKEDTGDKENKEEDKEDKELKKMMDKVGQEERREHKKEHETKKKQEWRKKHGLNENFDVGAEDPDLFSAKNKFAQLLENAEVAVNSDEEDAANDSENEVVIQQEPESDTDRIAREEAEQVLLFRGIKERSKESLQKDLKKKKETRRQLRTKEWATEMEEVGEEVEQKAAEEHKKRMEEEEASSEDNDDSSDDDSDDGMDQLPPASNQGLSFAEMFGCDGDDEEEEEKIIDTKDGKKKKKANWKDEERANRWFARDIFATLPENDDVEMTDASTAEPTDESPKEKDELDSSDDEDIQEMDDKDVVKLPLTDKEKRKKRRDKKRRLEEKKTEREKKKKKSRGDLGSEEENEDEDKKKNYKQVLEIVPAEAPLENALTLTATDKPMIAPTNPRDQAEIQAFGSLMIRKKSRMDLIDAGYNRYCFDDIPDQLPDWFLEDETKHNKPELPITKELMATFNAKLREINSRPIRKVMEAQARKKKRLNLRLDKLRKEAKSMSENPEMNSGSKARQMERLVRKAKNADKRTVKMMAIKKGGGGNNVTKKDSKVGKNVQTRVVDKRLKKDKRGLKKAASKNKKKGASKKQANKKKGSKQGGVKKKVAKKNRGGKKG